jgi:hypothetical protein
VFPFAVLVELLGAGVAGAATQGVPPGVLGAFGLVGCMVPGVVGVGFVPFWVVPGVFWVGVFCV